MNLTSLYSGWPHWQCVGLASPWMHVRVPVAEQVLRFVALIFTVQYVELNGYCQ